MKIPAHQVPTPRIPRVVLVGTLLLCGAACSSTDTSPSGLPGETGDGGTSSGAGGEGGTSGGPIISACRGSVFAQGPESWSLPVPARGTSWQTGDERYTLMDIHGDGKPDLVVTTTTKDTNVGQTKWLVYKNSGSSFAAEPEIWSLPAPARGTSWQTGDEHYTLMDIHGDGKPDLLITATARDANVGQTKWLVYKNSGSSFAAEPETWSLPAPARGTSWQTGDEHYTLMDIHGDGKPDLLITATARDANVGQTKWLVYKNSGSSFAAEPETWSLPAPARGTSWQTGDEHYTLMDIHGDRKPDLLITATARDANVGQTKWLVYKNSGSAFGNDAESWSLPAPARGTSWQTGDEHYTLMDIHGDGKPVLLITATARDPNVGQKTWLVFDNSGTSFASTSTTWSLPVPARGTSWQTGEERYTLMDIHGDGRPDLLITGTARDANVGQKTWSIFPNNCE